MGAGSPATLNNNIPKNVNEECTVASCIYSPNMLTEDGLNGENKCPLKYYMNVVHSEVGRQQTRGGILLYCAKKTPHNECHSGIKNKEPELIGRKG